MDFLIVIEIKLVLAVGICKFSYFVFKNFVGLVALYENLFSYYIGFGIVFKKMNAAFSFIVAAVKISVHIKEYISGFVDS